MNAPQVIYIALTALGLGISLCEHGKPRTGKHNFFTSLAATAILVWILHSGGFFA